MARRPTGALSGLALAGLLLGLTAAPAAGTAEDEVAPTSVHVVVPGTGRVQTIAYTERAYEALALLVGARETRPSISTDGPGVDSFRTVGVTLTWLRHQVEPWRVDRIFLTRDDGVWIATRLADEGSPRDAPQTWSRPEAPDLLVASLERLGVAQAARGHGAFPDKPGRFASGFVQPATVEAGESSTPGPGSTPADSGWWALIAVALGIAALAGGARLRDRLARTRPAADDVLEADEELSPAAEHLTWGRPRR